MAQPEAGDQHKGINMQNKNTPGVNHAGNNPTVENPALSQDPETKFALEAVRLASLLVRHVQNELVLLAGSSPAGDQTSISKSDLSPVTVADFAAQAVVAHSLARSFPDEALVAEEDSSELRKPESAQMLDAVTRFVRTYFSNATPEIVCNWIDHNRVDTARRFWTLDPIDGTKGFLRGDQYAIALALVVDGQVQVGVLGCPNLVEGYRPDLEGSGSLVIARRGQGAWVTDLAQPGNYERLSVSRRYKPEEARLLRSFESGHTNVDQIDLFAQAMGVQAQPVLMDSQAKYAVLAAGKGDLLLRLLSPSRPDYREKIWDQAAGSIVLEEAGGKITDLFGKDLDFRTGRSLTNNRGILASNGLLHPAALSALERVGA
jgi:3'(2'), 5'-bisphosphate nucleotidase